MSKLDELKKKGFTSEVDVEVEIIHYDWNLEKFTNNVPRNSEKIKAMMRSTTARVPFVNFNSWLLLYKGVDIDSLTPTDLDLYFDEYKMYYLSMNADGRLSIEFSEYLLEDNFNSEVKEYTGVVSSLNVVDVSKHITIGNVLGVDVSHTSNLIVQRAKSILGDNGNDQYRRN